LDAFDPPYMQRALLEVALLSVAAGLLGTWIVLRGLAFFSHAAGTAAFPGLVLADDLALLALVGLAIVAALSTVGALLATALFVVPAATVRLLVDRLAAWQVATVALVLVEGVAGLWLSVQTNAPPGATIAVIAGGAFALAALWRALRARGRRPSGASALAGAALLATLLAGCGSSSSGASHGRLDVVATTTQLGDFARQVGGSRVVVHQILQPNTDPHDYEPRPGDVQATTAAKLVFANGDGLDHWMGKVVSDSGTGARTVDVGAGLPVKLPGESSGPEASRYDPHWWHDPVNARAAVERIRQALDRADPAAAADFDRNARAYEARLDTLDRGIRVCFVAVPPAQRKLVTDHDAFGYFAQRYGIHVIGAVIPSQTTQAQTSAGAVAKLTDQIRREGVRAVFPESSLSPKVAQAIARDTGATSGLTLYGDTLGPRGSAGATYLTMEQANADAMVRGFTGGAARCAIAGIP
jgi:ABC-type Zn uptake system ZnuABC Zn-binding protein ZnuA